MKAALRELYEAGEYDALSAVLRPVAEVLVAAAQVRPGGSVLDIGTGDGNVARAAAARGAPVVGCDVSPVQAARARARGVDQVLVADATALPFADHSFATVLSCFAAIFVPDPEQTVAEMLRVLVPGGTMALTSWPDDGLWARSTAITRAAAADPARFPNQDLGWGDPATIRARLPGEVRLERRTLLMDPAQRQVAGERDFATRYFATHPPTRALEEEHAELLRRFTAPDGRLRFDYLVVVSRA